MRAVAFGRETSIDALSVRRWTLQEWLSNEPVWRELMTRAASDQLFLSWEWLVGWWKCYGDSLGHTPEILAVYRGERLEGVAPLYRRHLNRHGFIPLHSVQMIGLSWRDPEPLISEYLDVVAAAGQQEAVRHCVLRFLLAERDWNEFVVGFTPAGAQWLDAYAMCASSHKYYARELDPSVSYQADLSVGFAAYLRDLGQSTRRSVWTLRRRLANHGEVAFEQLQAEDIESGFADLNRLHRLRWHKPAFEGRRLEFHMAMARGMAIKGELALSRLRLGSRVVSVVYDLRKGASQYNLKMGFDPKLSSQISLGLIHLGLAMETAAEQGITSYDFLAGPGRTNDFKRLLSQRQRELSCVQMLQGSALSVLYRLRDGVRS
jgi:CelD/BcsL family acetyltransferase involved in cellulose biosynthesis